MESKPFWQSKTFWVQILGIVAVAIPTTREFIQNNLGESAAAWAVINIVVRMITKDKVSIS